MTGNAMGNNPVRDHLGNGYPTQKAMCEAYGIDPTTYSRRRRSGLDVEHALAPYDRRPDRIRTDHTGKEFPSARAMCRAWGINSVAYHNRRQYGWSVERALTEPVRPRARRRGGTAGGTLSVERED